MRNFSTFLCAAAVILAAAACDATKSSNPLSPERSYFWRARAGDGANTGPYSSAASFDVFTPIIIDPPSPVSPAINATGQSVRPTLVVGNASHSGPVGAINYQFEISDTETF